MSSTLEQLAERRALRAEIARQRRRINQSVVDVQREGRRLVSWRTYAARYPVAALGASFAAGLAISAGLPRSGWLRWVAGAAFKSAFASVPALLAKELADTFAHAASAVREN